MSFSNKIRTILWKNYVVRKRSWLMSIIEICFPCVWFILVLYLYLQGGIGVQPTTIPAQSYPVEDGKALDECFKYAPYPYDILYVPNNTVINALMSKVKQRIFSDKEKDQSPLFHGSYLRNLIGLESEPELENWFYYTYNETVAQNSFGFGVVFEKYDNNGDEFKYKIRSTLDGWNLDVPFASSLDDFLRGSFDLSNPRLYTTSCFITLQKVVDQVYIETFGNKSTNIEIGIQPFPSPEHQLEATLSQVLTYLLPYMVVIGFMFIILDQITKIVFEKETGAKELMKLMGLKPWMVWFGWLLNALLVGFIVVTVVTITLKLQVKENYPPLLAGCNVFILWLFLMIYLINISVFVFVICAIMSKPLLAKLLAMLVYLIPFILLNIHFKDTRNLLLRLLFCVLCPGYNWSTTSLLIISFEKQGGAGFSNFFETPLDAPHGLTMGWMLLSYVVSIGLYSFLTWYFDNVMPGPFGRARPFYFIFEVFSWRRHDVIPDVNDVDDVHIEKPPANTGVGLSVRNLTKVFRGGVYAVNGVNLDIYKGQITALLGHNGAGKTTTMSILTGMYSPTSGSVYEHLENAKSYNIFENMGEFRNHLGLCPQHNLFIPYFTVFEHLLFFGMLKGLSTKKAAIDAQELLRLLNIQEKKNKMTTELSGGMKRKLSLAIALIGDPKILILDEPTSGLDPESRRELWNVLLSIRQSRTIIITTHFMEEADVLGDRIAIMDHGKVVCYGTPLFLKKLYGTGYNLTLLTNQDANRKQITALLRTVIADSALKTTHKGQLTYSLPSDTTAKFSELFSLIEQQKQALGITSMGISLTTMEEVFLRAGLDSDKKIVDEKNGTNEEEQKLNNSRESTFRRTSSTEYLTSKRVRGIALLFQQFRMLFHKKILYTMRKPLVTLVYIFLTVLMFFVAMLTLRASKSEFNGTAVTLDLDSMYPNSEVFVGYKKNVESYAKAYETLLKNSPKMFQDKNITEVLLEESEKDIDNYKYGTSIASDWNASIGIALHSTMARHSAPISLNILLNTISKKSGLNKKFTVVNHPLLMDTPTINPMCGSIIQKVQAAGVWFAILPLGLLFTIASFISFPLEERMSSAKQLQLMTGLSAATYWAALLLWDLLIYLVTLSVALIIVYVMDVNSIVTTAKPFGVLILLYVLYGLAGIMFAYFFSFLLNSTAGVMKFIMWNLIIGVAGSFVLTILSVLKELYPDALLVGDGLFSVAYHLMLLDPHYAVSKGTINYVMLSYDYAACTFCNGSSFSAYSHLCNNSTVLEYFINDDKHILKEVVFLGFDFFFYIAVIALIEFRLWAKFKEMIMQMIYSRQMDIGTMDDDVRDEKDRVDAGRVHQGNTTSPLMVVDDLAKRFRAFQAVKGVSFQIASGECFGLLGVNGAGKTTTFRMLTGDELPTSGNATITKYNLLENRTKFLAQIGYCPQFDGINGLLTGRETLELMGQLRGLPAGSAAKQAAYWIDFLGFTEYANRLCGTYSGGNKRKLSTAMALIADPVIVFLDEPTSGVDPVARRKLWDVLTRCRRSGQSIILTSHSMDECEALCNRLTIMVRGQMMCIGNIQYLKQRFGQGFTVMVKIAAEHQGEDDKSKADVKREIEMKFAPQCLLKDEHAGLLHYHVTNTDLTWSYLFKTMENVRQNFPSVEDYTVSETTLEQVFISFAKQGAVQ